MNKEQLWGLETKCADLFDEESTAKATCTSMQSYSKYKRNILDDGDMDVSESFESPTKRSRKQLNTILSSISLDDISYNMDALSESEEFGGKLLAKVNPLIYPSSSRNLNTIMGYKNKLELHKDHKNSSSSVSKLTTDHDQYFYTLLGQRLQNETLKLMKSSYQKQVLVVMDTENKSLPALLVAEIAKHFQEKDRTKKDEQPTDSDTKEIQQNVLQTYQLQPYYAVQLTLSNKEQQEHWPIEDMVMSICDLVKYLNQSSLSQTRTRFLSADNGISIIKTIKCIQFIAENTRSLSTFAPFINSTNAAYLGNIDPSLIVKKGKEFYTMWDIQEYRTKVSTSFIDEYTQYLTTSPTTADQFADVITYFETLKKLLLKWVRIANIQEQYIEHRCDQNAVGFIPFMNSLISFCALQYHIPICIMEVDAIDAYTQQFEHVVSYSVQPIESSAVIASPILSFMIHHLQGTDVFVPSWKLFHYTAEIPNTSSAKEHEVAVEEALRIDESILILQQQIASGIRLVQQAPPSEQYYEDIPFIRIASSISSSQLLFPLSLQQQVEPLKAFLLELQQYQTICCPVLFQGYAFLPTCFTFTHLQELILRLNSIRKYQQDHRLHRNQDYVRQEFQKILSTLISFAWIQEEEEEQQQQQQQVDKASAAKYNTNKIMDEEENEQLQPKEDIRRSITGVMVVLWKDMQQRLQCDILSSFSMMEIRKFLKVKLCHPYQKSHVYTLNKETIEQHFHSYCDYFFRIVTKYGFLETIHFTPEMVQTVMRCMKDNVQLHHGLLDRRGDNRLQDWKVSEPNALDSNIILGPSRQQEQMITSYLSKETIQHLRETVLMKYSSDSEDLNDILNSICDAHI